MLILSGAMDGCTMTLTIREWNREYYPVPVTIGIVPDEVVNHDETPM